MAAMAVKVDVGATAVSRVEKTMDPDHTPDLVVQLAVANRMDTTTVVDVS